MRTPTLLMILSLAACSQQPSADGETSGSNDSSSSDESSTETETGTPEPDLPASGDPCDCEANQLCVAVCETGDFNDSWSIQDSFCLADPACELPDVDHPACREVACGPQFVLTPLLDGCGPYQGYDILCPPWASASLCDPAAQDCPEAEKCVIAIAEADYSAAWCVPVQGIGAAGDDCSSDGFGLDGGTDSCDATSMCWNGEASIGPFAGTCQPFCHPIDSSCPNGMICEPVIPNFPLCIPL